MAFRNCSLEGDLVIPESVVSIGFEAFSTAEENSDLINIFIPDTVVDISPNAFYGFKAATFHCNERIKKILQQNLSISN